MAPQVIEMYILSLVPESSVENIVFSFDKDIEIKI